MCNQLLSLSLNNESFKKSHHTLKLLGEEKAGWPGTESISGFFPQETNAKCPASNYHRFDGFCLILCDPVPISTSSSCFFLPPSSSPFLNETQHIVQLCFEKWNWNPTQNMALSEQEERLRKIKNTKRKRRVMRIRRREKL